MEIEWVNSLGELKKGDKNAASVIPFLTQGEYKSQRIEFGSERNRIEAAEENRGL